LIADFYLVLWCMIVAIRSSMPDVAIPLMPLTDFVFRDMKKFGDRPALVSQPVLILLKH